MVAFLILIILLYFIPTFVAFKRKTTNKYQVLVVNVFLGWTGLGWILALVMSLSDKLEKKHGRN